MAKGTSPGFLPGIVLSAFFAVVAAPSGPANAVECSPEAPCPPIADAPKETPRASKRADRTPEPRPIELSPMPKAEAEAEAEAAQGEAEAAGKKQTLRWNIQNTTKYRADAQLYSQDRDWLWPDAKRVFQFHDTKKYSFKITCRKDEKICLGAWARKDTDIYWGVGYRNEYRCKNCCFFCGKGETPRIKLTY